MSYFPQTTGTLLPPNKCGIHGYHGLRICPKCSTAVPSLADSWLAAMFPARPRVLLDVPANKDTDE
jgi:hypothetical protein